ncbi:sugar porter family MFS transporter [Bartonella sp. HY329]|uniref:sugar porter family MFS transporter n=1 Tax=unclassified Bartonella TaxID=2645622 RepID=UPI0021C6453F|nr:MULTISPECIES: sugar porter family MFS transporter [unclassified Bartonella]UXM95045.1 sugar porter family MFS transporter [Bartonella sp. HY329]UXN09368.1 sugar porter family MFS transporter [Bartonella sp. HY328]
MTETRSNDFKIAMLNSLASIFLFCFLASILEGQFWQLFRYTWSVNSSMPLLFYYTTDILPIYPVLGGLIFGFLADRFNQKLILAFTALFLMIASLCSLTEALAFFNENIMIFVIFYAFIGTIIMMGAEIAVSTALIFNYSPATKRGFYTSLVPLIIVAVVLAIMIMNISMIFITSQYWDTWIFVFFISILSFIIFIRRSLLLRLNFDISNKCSKGNKRGLTKFIHVILFSQITVIFILHWQYLNKITRFLSGRDLTNGALYLFALKVVGILIFVIMLAIWGKIIDKTSTYKVFTIGLLGSLLLIGPSYWCLSNIDHSAKLIIPILWFGIFASALIAPLANLILELVSSKTRSMATSLLTIGVLFLPYFQYSSGLAMLSRFIYFTSDFTIIAISMMSLVLAFIAMLLSKKLDASKHKAINHEIFE